MRLYINRDFDDEQRLTFAQAIFSAQDFTTMNTCLQYWRVFIPWPLPRISEGQNEVEYVEGVYDRVRGAAMEWFLSYRILALETMVEELQNPNGGRLGDHR